MIATDSKAKKATRISCNATFEQELHKAYIDYVMASVAFPRNVVRMEPAFNTVLG